MGNHAEPLETNQMQNTMNTHKQPFDDLMGQIRVMKKRSDKYEAEERDEGNVDEAGTHLRVSSVLAELERLGGEFEKRAMAAGEPPRLPDGLPPGCLPNAPADTPETDALISSQEHKMDLDYLDIDLSAWEKLADHARKLERERDEARALAGYWRSTAGDVAAMPIKEHALPWENNLSCDALRQ